MSFGLPVDPSNVKTLLDLDLSYALASTLVDWTDDRNLRDGVAKPVSSKSENEITFQLRPEAKWSDGTPISATHNEVVEKHFFTVAREVLDRETFFYIWTRTKRRWLPDLD